MIDKVLARRAALVIGTLIVVAVAWTGPVDRLAQEHVESGLKRALITFAVARTANAVISAVQETTVAIQPFGLGVTMAPAQALDPLNDLVEQFSTLMLAACVSFAAQRVLITIGGHEWVSVFLTLAIAGWAAWNWRDRAPLWLTRIVLVVLLVRFAVPIAALGSEAAFRVAMASDYAKARSAVQATSEELRRMAPENQSKATGAFERLREWWDRKKQDVQAYFGELKDRAENMVRHIVVLMAVFLVQTLVLPLVFVWLLQRLLRGVLRLGSDHH